MTKQDYEIIAKLIVTAREFHPNQEANDALDAVANMLAGAFSVSNERFNVELFRQKAGC
jgi:hypothetical protein